MSFLIFHLFHQTSCLISSVHFESDSHSSHGDFPMSLIIIVMSFSHVICGTSLSLWCGSSTQMNFHLCWKNLRLITHFQCCECNIILNCTVCESIVSKIHDNGLLYCATWLTVLQSRVDDSPLDEVSWSPKIGNWMKNYELSHSCSPILTNCLTTAILFASNFSFGSHMCIHITMCECASIAITQSWQNNFFCKTMIVR